MKKRIYLSSIVLLLGVMVGSSYSSAAVEVKEKMVPMADSGKMMLEHVGMDCTICHGVNGPKGVQMGNHPKQHCTDCHVKGVKPLAHKAKRINLSRAMMLKHGASLNCKVCHGENGPTPMMLEHVGMDCQTCHVVEER